MSSIKNKNILLIMGGYSTKGVGEQFIEAMLRRHNKANIHRFSVITTAIPEKKDIHEYPTTLQQAPFSVAPGLASLQYWRFKKSGLATALDNIKKIVKEKEIDLVWIILNGSLTIQIASSLHKQIDVPYVAHAWDAPEYLLASMHLDCLTKKNLMRQYACIFENAARGVVVSESMGEIFFNRYSVEYSTMVLCPAKTTWRQVKESKSKSKISVVFAGSLYAYKEWNSFLDAVEYFNSSQKEQKVSITCIGNVSRWAKKKSWVNYESIKPAEEAATIVNGADIAYLPYWMDKSHALSVKTAFPGKMSFYVSSGTPVFFHGPEDSTPTQFLQKHKVGKACHSKKAEDIIETLQKILHEDFQKQYKQSQKETLEAVFHPDRCVEIFEETVKLALQTTSEKEVSKNQ